MAILYDGKGNQLVIVEGGGNDKELTYEGLSTTWIANAETAYNAMLTELQKLSYSGVPFFIQTDLHGRSNAPARWLHNKNKSVKNLNLGDDVVDYYSITERSQGEANVEEFITANGGTINGTTYKFTDSSIGIQSNPIKISTAGQFAMLVYLINTRAKYTRYQETVYFYNQYYEIAADIDMGDYFFPAI